MPTENVAMPQPMSAPRRSSTGYVPAMSSG